MSTDNDEKFWQEAKKEARSRIASNLRILAQQVESGDVMSLAVSFIQSENHAMGQLLWTETQLSLFQLLAAIDVSKFDALMCYSHTAHREPGNMLKSVPKEKPIMGDLNDE